MAKNKTSRYIPYIENQYIPTKTLGDDFEKPDFIARILRLRKSGLTIWPMTPCWCGIEPSQVNQVSFNWSPSWLKLERLWLSSVVG
jgi:hypothetical protein